MFNKFLKLHVETKLSYIVGGICVFVFFNIYPLHAQTTIPEPAIQIANSNSTLPLNTEELNQSSTPSPELPPEPASSSLLLAITRAKEQLEAYLANERAKPGYKPAVVNTRQVGLKVILAVWNQPQDQLDLVTVVIFGNKLTPLTPTPYIIRLKQNNGVNSEFEIVGAEAYKVLAIAHPVFTDIGTAKRPKYTLESRVYVPFAVFLQTPEIIQLGKIHLDNIIKSAYLELRQQNISSVALPNTPLIEVIEPQVTKSIIAIEHVSAAQLINGNIDNYLSRFYTILGLNNDQAYAYARSRASARGIAQFIPSTYNRLLKLRPELKLEPDFVKGMTDQVNAVKAQVALLDYNLTFLPASIRLQHANDPKTLGSYLAAMYNGGPTRVRRAIELWQEDWARPGAELIQELKQAKAQTEIQIKSTQQQLNSKNLSANTLADLKIELADLKNELTLIKSNLAKSPRYYLKKETVGYVAKYLLVYDYLYSQTLSFKALVTNVES